MTEKKREQGEKSAGRPRRRFRFLIVLTVCAIVLCTAALFIVPWAVGYYTDGFSISQPTRDAVLRGILWETPRLVEGGLNADPQNYEPTISADGSTMIFTRGKAKRNADLFFSRRIDEKWGEPVPLEAINTLDDELGPELSRDGRYLYFYSNRPGGQGGYDIWLSRWTGTEWTAPENLGGSVNSEFNEYGPGLSPDDGTLFFSSNRLRRKLTEKEKEAWQATLREEFWGSDYDIFSAAAPARPAEPGSADGLPPFPRFDRAKRVDALNSPGDDGQVAVTPRGDFIYFSSNRRGGLGGFDIYRCRVFQNKILEPENMGAPVNTSRDDMDPTLFMEGHGLVFSSNRLAKGSGRPFLIYRTISREVITRQDWSALTAFFRALDAIKWPLLFLLLGLLALLYLLRYLGSQRFRMHASLLQKCLLLSLLLHLLLALLLSTWVVTSSLYDMDGESDGELFLDVDALAGERIGLEIREQVARLETKIDTEPLDLRADTFVKEARTEPLAPVEHRFETRESPKFPAAEFDVTRHEEKEQPRFDRVTHTARLEPVVFENRKTALEEPDSSPVRATPEPGSISDRFERSERESEATSASIRPSPPSPQRIQGIESRDSSRESALDEAELAARPLPGADESLPAAQHLDMDDQRETAEFAKREIELEVPSGGRATPEQEMPPVAHPEGAKRKELIVPSEKTAPRSTAALDWSGSSKIKAMSALTAPRPSRPLIDDPEPPRHSVSNPSLPLRTDPLRKRLMESFRKKGEIRSLDEKKFDLEEKESQSRQVPLAVRRDPPPLSKPAPRKTATKLRTTSALEMPVRARSPERQPEMARFEHDEPRTYHGLEMKSRKVIFCLDVSASMEWNDRIGDARQELLRLIDTLNDSVSFNIITFSGEVSTWNRRGVQPGTMENLSSAKRFVERARIASDGTNTVGALTEALSDEEVQSIYFLSDGHPTSGFTTESNAILRRVRELQNGRKVAIHTIAYIKGDPPRQWRNRVPPKERLIDLMTRLADQNNGRCVVFDE